MRVWRAPTRLAEVMLLRAVLISVRRLAVRFPRLPPFTRSICSPTRSWCHWSSTSCFSQIFQICKNVGAHALDYKTISGWESLWICPQDRQGSRPRPVEPRECGAAKHAPDAESGKRVTGAGNRRYRPYLGGIASRGRKRVVRGGQTSQPNRAKGQAGVAGHHRMLAIPARAHSSSCSRDNAPSTPQAPSIRPLRKIGNPPRTRIRGPPCPITSAVGG